MMDKPDGEWLKRDYSLLSYNTFGLDVKTKLFFEYRSVDDLRSFIEKGLLSRPYLHVGTGSNLLFTGDFDGLVLHSGILGIELIEETDDSVLVRVGAGVVWDDFVAYAVQKEWYGIENLSLIPGEVGAAAVQNIGAYGVEVKDVIASVDTINDEGVEKSYSVEECHYRYRHSSFKEHKTIFVTHVSFRLSKEKRYTLDYGALRNELTAHPDFTLATLREVIIRVRQMKLPDPKDYGNAGSFFMNPIVEKSVFDHLKIQYPDMPFYDLNDGRIKIPAGWLIEACGWKGRSLGMAGVYHKQALVLVNLGGAKGADIVALSDAVRQSVREKFNIEICPEVNFI